MLTGLFRGSRRAGHLALILAAVALAGCETAAKEPVIKTVEVKIPTPVPCVGDKVPGPKDYPDTDKALRSAPGPAERYNLIAAGRILRDQRLKELEPIVDACRRIPDG